MFDIGILGSAYRRCCLLDLVGARFQKIGDQENAVCPCKCDLEGLRTVEIRFDDFVSELAVLAWMAFLARRGIAAGPLAAGILRVAHAPWVLRVASLIFLLGVVASLGLPRAEVGARPETPDDRVALHARSILAAGSAMALLRGAVGFFTFFAAFVLKTQREPAWIYGLVLMMSAIGTGIGSGGICVDPFARRVILKANSSGGPGSVRQSLTIAVTSTPGVTFTVAVCPF